MQLKGGAAYKANVETADINVQRREKPSEPVLKVFTRVTHANHFLRIAAPLRSQSGRADVEKGRIALLCECKKPRRHLGFTSMSSSRGT